jgi:hypothetical protein
VAALPDGSLAVAGSTTSGGSGFAVDGEGDAWVLRLTAEGEIRPEVATSQAAR